LLGDGDAGGCSVAVAVVVAGADAVVASGAAAAAFVDTGTVVAAPDAAAEEAGALADESAAAAGPLTGTFWLAAGFDSPAGGAGGTSVALDLLVQAPIFKSEQI
jgi:hypothetical protein